jgi:arylsulfatase A-like enzyme
VKAGTQSNELSCLTDFMATCADIVGAKIPADAGEDSVSMLPVWLQSSGRSGGSLREAVVHHSIDGYFAIRKGKWKLELCAGSGGWAAPREYAARQQKLPLLQLYDMSGDSGEQKNVAAEHPDVVEELTALLEKYVREGRSTPGPKQPNDVPINLRKVPKPPAAAPREN